jgi:hypothetical protein
MKLKLKEIIGVSKHEACHPMHRYVRGREDIPCLIEYAVKHLRPVNQDKDVFD